MRDKAVHVGHAESYTQGEVPTFLSIRLMRRVKSVNDAAGTGPLQAVRLARPLCVSLIWKAISSVSKGCRVKMEKRISVPETVSSRDRIKAVALRMFSERDVDDVSVRAILTAAGHKNVSAIGYYFESKAALIEELLTDGAAMIDQQVMARLDELEAQGGLIRLRDLVAVLIRSFATVHDNERDACYLQFFNKFSLRHQTVWRRVISTHLDIGYRRIVVHFRRILGHIPPAVLNQRIMFMMLMIGTSLAMREAIDDDDDVSDFYAGKEWSSPIILENLIDSAVGILREDVSQTVASMISS
ncbi:MAG: TetR/AcrR family transcriptional regulator [Sphingobium sp.]